ncbi:MAG: class I SAM-dependent methyltransferase [Burkholderiales bacterium]
MGIYARRILPHLTDWTMQNDEAARYRALVVPHARGLVLEVGAGSGLNLPFYGSAVERLTALDPSPELLHKARKRARGTQFPVEFVEGGAEQIPLADHSVDSVVMTWTLCSIAHPERALAEIRRVLKPDGVLWFAEHGLAPQRRVAAFQACFTPLWARFSGGCHLDRKTDDLLVAAGFRLEDLVTEYAKGPRIFSYQYSGRARLNVFSTVAGL